MLTEMIFLGLWKGLSEQECLEPTFELNQRSYRSGTADADQNPRHGRTQGTVRSAETASDTDHTEGYTSHQIILIVHWDE